MLVTCMMPSLEANNKLINGKGNWEPRVKGAGEKSRYRSQNYGLKPTDHFYAYV